MQVSNSTTIIEEWSNSDCYYKIPKWCCKQVLAWTWFWKLEEKPSYQVRYILINYLIYWYYKDIYGVDLRHLPSVNEFIIHVTLRYKRIDITAFIYPFFAQFCWLSLYILINNAAQTIRRPRAYYRALIEQEGLLNTGNTFTSKFLVKHFNLDPYLIESASIGSSSTFSLLLLFDIKMYLPRFRGKYHH